jgi:hypothetical protein
VARAYLPDASWCTSDGFQNIEEYTSMVRELAPLSDSVNPR